MSECYVSLDRYKADLSRYVARDKLLIERLDCKLRSIDYRINVSGDLACVGEKQIVEDILALLRTPLYMWFTQQEWSSPISVCNSKFDKFHSVSDGVQTSWFDDIGENPYPNQVR